MNPKVNFMLVGIFVIGICLASLFFILWLSFGYGETKQKFYLIYMKESVAGLSQDAAVKFNGVNVGTITSIHLDNQDPSIVVIKIQVQEDVPISVDTRATLMSQGLTGLSYINLNGGNAHSLPLKAIAGLPYPVIPTNPSLLVRLDSTISKLTFSLDKVSTDFDILLRPQNQEYFTHILKNVADISQTIADNREPIGLTMEHANQLLANANTQTLPALNQSLMMLQAASVDLTSLTQELMTNPSVLLTGPKATPLGPGEK